MSIALSGKNCIMLCSLLFLSLLLVMPWYAQADSLDWRNYGGASYVTPVKSQGSCGACWAFATVAALESQVLLAPGPALNLSEQTLISCDRTSSTTGCSGGFANDASDYLKQTGTPPNSMFPYKEATVDCDKNGTYGWWNYAYKINSWNWVSTGNTASTVSNIKNALKSNGPLAILMRLYYDFWSKRIYSGGVYCYTGTNSEPYEGEHYVLLIGFQDDNSNPAWCDAWGNCGYFIVKNSYNTDWGNSGYGKVAYSQIGWPVNFGMETISYGGAKFPALQTTPVSLESVSLGGIGIQEIQGGGGSLTGTVVLSGTVPAGEATVYLNSSDPLVSVNQAAVYIPVGSDRAQFTVTAGNLLYPNFADVTITAKYGTETTSTEVRVLNNYHSYSVIYYDSPPTVVYTSATTVVGGQQAVTGWVSWNSWWGGSLALSVSNTQVAHVSAHWSNNYGTFVVSTSQVSSPTQVTITATEEGGAYWGDYYSGQIMVLPATQSYIYPLKAFSDVSTNYWAYSNIENIFYSGIYSGTTPGCSNGNYCPSAAITREQMASYIITALYGNSFTYTLVPYFSDVPAGDPYFAYVQKLKDLSITTVTGNFSPASPVTRDEMAAFLVRALQVQAGQGTEAFTYTANPYFTDVPSTYPFFKYIQKIKDDGITVVTGTYNPTGNATMDQMAAFISRSFLKQTSAVSSGNSQEYTTQSCPDGYVYNVSILSCQAVPVAYTITAVAGAGGSITPSSTIIVNSGSSQTYTIIPSAGNAIASVLIDGVSVGVVNSYTFSNVTASHTISATFDSAVTPSASANGSISPSTPQTVNYTATTSFTVTPSTGYSISSVTGCGGTLSGITYTTGPITGNCTVSATFVSMSAQPVRRVSGATVTYYYSLQGAYNDSALTNGDVIQVQAGVLSGNLMINKNVSITMQGGYDSNFTSNAGNITVIKGQLQTYPGGGDVTGSNFLISQ